MSNRFNLNENIANSTADFATMGSVTKIRQKHGKSTYIFLFNRSILFIAPLSSWANISISPTSLELSEISPTGEIILENQGSEAKLFEVTIKKWMQKDTKDIFEETDDVLVIPLSAFILPAKKQKFRVILRKFAASKTQNNYRLFFAETRKRSPAKSGLFFFKRCYRGLEAPVLLLINAVILFV